MKLKSFLYFVLFLHLRFWSWQGKITILFTAKSSGIVMGDFCMLLGLSVVFTRVLVGKLKFGLWKKDQELHEPRGLLCVLSLVFGLRGAQKFSSPIFPLSLPSKSSTLGLFEASKSSASNTSTSKMSTPGAVLSEVSKSSTLAASLPPLSSTLSVLSTFLLLP